MLSPFGKELRTLRIHREIRLGTLAKMLRVSAAYLSAVETGKKNVPDTMVNEIAIQMKLTTEEVLRLKEAVGASPISVRIPLQHADTLSRKLAIGFARRFSTLTERQKKQLGKLLLENDKNKDAKE
jgi:transcriptional regulator with XRE-family HTH domain